MANEKTNGLNNLKTIHKIQKDGILQELLRDLRSTKSQLEMLLKSTSRFIASKKEMAKQQAPREEVVEPKVEPAQEKKEETIVQTKQPFLNP